MDYATISLEDAARLVLSGSKQVDEFPVKMRANLEQAVAGEKAKVASAAELEADKAEVRAEVAAKKSTKKGSKKSASKK